MCLRLPIGIEVVGGGWLVDIVILKVETTQQSDRLVTECVRKKEKRIISLISVCI